MDLVIVNHETNRSTHYTQAQIRKDARFAVKDKGKLVGFHLEVHEPAGRIRLAATYECPDGMRAVAYCAI